MSGPCTEWVTLAAAQADPDAVGLSAPILQDAVTATSEILWALSGRQFSGVCRDTIRPTRRHYYLEQSPGQWWRWESSQGIYVCTTPPERFAGCAPLSEISLGAYPVRDVLEVRVDGQIVPPAAYRVDDRRWLVRTDGEHWPCCQDLAGDALTDVGTFQVIFEWGQAPPESGVIACRRMAVELAKSWSGSPCRLPERIQNVSVPGATYSLLDPLTFLEKGRTGIYYVDLFLASVNPHGLQRRAQVISPDIRRPVRRTSTTPGS